MSDPALHYSFAGAADLAEAERVALLGGKGAAVARMTAMGLPVPPGFTLTTEVCRRVNTDGWFAGLDGSIAAGIADLEQSTGRTLGSASSPLLVSVRSGAAVSMPGMMDTVLNVGMTGAACRGLGESTGDHWFAWDTARRFVQSYASIVLGVPADLLSRISDDCLGDDEGRSLDEDALAAATARMRKVLAEQGHEIPDDPLRQVRQAVAAVFSSWRSERAHTYRRVEGIDESLGTAATVQMMTFGNLGERSGTGVAFTRDPSTGEPGLVGDFLVRAQGEDVVAGTHSTMPVSQMRSLWPELADHLEEVASTLEMDLGDMADIEFTVEDDKLWLLQVRRGKRSPAAALRIAIDLAEDPAFDMTRAQAAKSMADIIANPPRRTNAAAPDDPDHLVLAEGIAASPGRVSGRLCVDIDDAIEAGTRGESLILIRKETSPADVAGMAEAAGLVTTLGGLVSHAAVVARGWGIPAIVGASQITVLGDGVRVDGKHYPVGEVLTVDGARGTLMLGEHPAEESEIEEVAILRRWQADANPLDATRDPSAPAPATTSNADSAGSAVPFSTQECERVLALKGAATTDVVADVLGCDRELVREAVAQLVASGEAQELPGDRVRLMPPALDRVQAIYESESTRLSVVIEPLWDDFHRLNDLLKEVVTAWQIRSLAGEEVPNDHTDSDYDAAVIVRLREEVHCGIVPIIDSVGHSEPRLNRYAQRLTTSVTLLEAGDSEMLAHPLRDSYHTVWFELHEELIRLSGRTRADEAAAGRG
ncbi:MAG: PEP/pyruvate-binding domain-containing protein [Microthrixaceae bacterium]